MTIKLTRFMTDVLKKQASISHWKAPIGVNKPAKLTQEIITKIKAQFGDLFLKDANYVIATTVDKGSSDFKKELKRLKRMIEAALDTKLAESEIYVLDDSAEPEPEPEEPEQAEEPEDDASAEEPPADEPLNENAPPRALLRNEFPIPVEQIERELQSIQSPAGWKWGKFEDNVGGFPLEKTKAFEYGDQESGLEFVSQTSSLMDDIISKAGNPNLDFDYEPRDPNEVVSTNAYVSHRNYCQILCVYDTSKPLHEDDDVENISQSNPTVAFVKITLK